MRENPGVVGKKKGHGERDAAAWPVLLIGDRTRSSCLVSPAVRGFNESTPPERQSRNVHLDPSEKGFISRTELNQMNKLNTHVVYAILVLLRNNGLSSK